MSKYIDDFEKFLDNMEDDTDALESTFGSKKAGLFNPDTVESLSPAEEASIVLAAIREECTAEEFNQIMMENCTEMEVYGLMPGEVATEAKKNIVRLNKATKLSSVQRRTALRIAAKNGDSAYAKYLKHRKEMLKYRELIFNKYDSKALSIARKILANGKRKTTSMKSPAGKNISEKIQKQIVKVDKKARTANGVPEKKAN